MNKKYAQMKTIMSQEDKVVQGSVQPETSSSLLWSSVRSESAVHRDGIDVSRKHSLESI